METVPSHALRPAAELALSLGLEPAEVAAYGPQAAKIELSAIERLAGVPDGRIISVTSMTPTRFGEGKTTTSISLAQGLGYIGEKPILCLREPSLGPVFGLKGGGTGGGRAQVVPMEEINLHFTGDIHAIGAANNLLAALVDTHLLQGNELGIDPHSVSWRRCLDMDDRALRQVVVGLGGRANGYPRETGFDITAASEVMAIVAVSRDLDDLRARLGAITIGQTFAGVPVTAEQIGAAGSMAVLLKQALKPNLVQTLEGQPALVHCGPFANIAHGNNSLVADLLGLKLADWVVTESGFGADMGFEKFVDIVCRLGGFAPSLVVLVATVQALRHHGGDDEGGGSGRSSVGSRTCAPRSRSSRPSAFPASSRSTGSGGTARPISTRPAGSPPSCPSRASPSTTASSVAARAPPSSPRRSSRPPRRRFPSRRSSTRSTTRSSGRSRRSPSAPTAPPASSSRRPRARRRIASRPPVSAGCRSVWRRRTSRSRTTPGAPVRPTGFTLPVRELRPYTGAGWVVAICGDIQTMPGLPADAAAKRIDLDAGGETVGLR